ncbi:L-rhamnose-binding lectin SML-like [Symphorus nematophorus]
MFHFSTTLCVMHTEIATTCEGNHVHRLSCDIGVIIVQTTLYGRADSETCSEGKTPEQTSNTECSLMDTVDVLKKKCDGKRVCELNTNVFEGTDPCSGTFKYLQTKYTCFPAIHQVTCEHSLAHLQCDEGQVITIYGADYGRRDKTTCSHERPIPQIQNTGCSSPATSIVSDRCNGKNSCVIHAGQAAFGDPCVGTYKYLEVAYICEYPVFDPKETT